MNPARALLSYFCNTHFNIIDLKSTLQLPTTLSHPFDFIIRKNPHIRRHVTMLVGTVLSHDKTKKQNSVYLYVKLRPQDVPSHPGDESEGIISLKADWKASTLPDRYGPHCKHL